MLDSLVRVSDYSEVIANSCPFFKGGRTIPYACNRRLHTHQHLVSELHPCPYTLSFKNKERIKDLAADCPISIVVTIPEVITLATQSVFHSRLVDRALRVFPHFADVAPPLIDPGGD